MSGFQSLDVYDFNMKLTLHLCFRVLVVSVTQCVCMCVYFVIFGLLLENYVCGC